MESFQWETPQTHCYSRTGNEEMDTEVNGFLRFTRLKTMFDSNASDTMNEDQAINNFFTPVPFGTPRELKLPSFFCVNFDGDIRRDAILISCKGMWAVELAKSNRNGFLALALSGNGWDSFSSHHNLEAGDLIFFEQIDAMVFRTRVYDLNQCEKQLTKSMSYSSIAEHNHQLERLKKRCFGVETEANNGGKVNPGGNFQLGKNEFIAHIEEPHLNRNHLAIPGEFVNTNDMRGKKRAILVNSAGDAWEVGLGKYQKNMSLFSRGWSVFAQENGLKKGDICIFRVEQRSTLATSTSIVMKVVVARFF